MSASPSLGALSPEPGPAVVAGHEISGKEIAAEAQYHPAASWQQACHEAARALVIQRLLLGRCRALGWIPPEVPPEDKRTTVAIERLMAEEVPVPSVSEDECREFYEQQLDGFNGPALFDPSHILIAFNAGDPAAKQPARELAGELLAKVLQQPEQFERLARKHSACPSAANGGRLGQVTLGETAGPFEAAFKALEQGQTNTEVVQTKHGFHIVRLNHRAQGERLPFEAVRNKVQIYLRDRNWRRALQRYVLRQAEEQGLQGLDLLAPGPSPPAAAAGPDVAAVGVSPLKKRRLPMLA